MEGLDTFPCTFALLLLPYIFSLCPLPLYTIHLHTPCSPSSLSPCLPSPSSPLIHALKFIPLSLEKNRLSSSPLPLFPSLLFPLKQKTGGNFSLLSYLLTFPAWKGEGFYSLIQFPLWSGGRKNRLTMGETTFSSPSPLPLSHRETFYMLISSLFPLPLLSLSSPSLISLQNRFPLLTHTHSLPGLFLTHSWKTHSSHTYIHIHRQTDI